MLLVIPFFIACCTPSNMRGNVEVASDDQNAPSLLTDNGLLYPPELWFAVDSTVLARLYYTQLKPDVAARWDLTPNETGRAIISENPDHDNLTAAYVVARAIDNGLIMPGAEGSFCVDDDYLTERWLSASDSELPAMTMLQVYAIAQQRNLSLPFEREQKIVLANAFSSDDLLHAAYAYELGESLEPGLFDINDISTNILFPIDAPPALASMQRAGLEYCSLPAGLTDMATANAFSSDAALVDVVTAFRNWGMESEADSLVAKYDQRRVLSESDVLDMPKFSGSEGSTYRVLRYEHDTSHRLTTDAERRAVQSTLQRSHARDLTVELAVMGSMFYLDPASVNSHEIKKTIRRATEMLQPNSEGELGLEDMQWWMSIAEICDSLDVDIRYPGLSDEAFERLESEEPIVVSQVSAKLVLAIELAQNGTGHEDVGRLLSILEARAREIDLDTASSLEIALLQAAYRAGANESLFVDSDVDKEFAVRQGNCRGGFKDMVREARVANSECSIETNRILKGNYW